MKKLKKRKPDRSPTGRQLSRRQENILNRKAKHRRKNMTDAEKRLAKTLGRRRVLGVKFFRHHVYDHMIVHFYSRVARLVILVRPDGMKWGRQDDVDYLERQGLSVLRFSETEILERLDWVMSLIWGVCSDRLGHASRRCPARKAEEANGAEVIPVDFEKSDEQESEKPDEHESNRPSSDTFPSRGTRALPSRPETPPVRRAIPVAPGSDLLRTLTRNEGRIGRLLGALAAAAAVGVGLRIASVTG